MVNTIHRSIVEKLQVEVPDTSGSNEIFGASSKLIETNEEYFKECLKNNVPCYVHRETFVVEHDTEKNKIIFKKYFVRKNPVKIKNLGKLGLKTYKTYKSLSIDIVTGEFSIYSIDSTPNRKKRKSKPIVRQTVFTTQVISLIESIFDVNPITEESILEGLSKALKILGYDRPITDMMTQDYLKKVFYNHDKKIHIYNYVTVFLMFNYFKKLDLELPNMCSILDYAHNFRTDKKNYAGKSIYTYYADYFGADELFIRGLFDYKDQLNTNVYYNNKGKGSTVDWFTNNKEIKENYYGIDEEGLTILYKLGYTLSDIKSNQALLNIVYNRDPHITFYRNPLLTLPIDILIENKEFFRSIVKDTSVDTIINMLRTILILRDVYGISISGEMYSMLSMNALLSALHKTVEETGLYSVSKPFLNRLKKQLPKNAKCSVTKHINKKITARDNPLAFIISNSESDQDIHATILVTYKTEKLKLMVYKSYINHRIYDKKLVLNSLNEPSKVYVLYKALDNFNRNYNKNKNKFKYVGLKAHYSKKRFEELLKEKYSEIELKLITKNLVYLK